MTAAVDMFRINQNMNNNEGGKSPKPGSSMAADPMSLTPDDSPLSMSFGSAATDSESGMQVRSIEIAS